MAQQTNTQNKQSLEQKKENELVAIVNQSGVELGVERVLQKNISLIPENIATDRIRASAGFYISNRQDLMELNNNAKLQMLYGVLKEAMVGCEAGIDYDILPFKGVPTIVRKKEGWFKVIDLVKPAEIIRFVCNVITKGDEYKFDPVTEDLQHEIKGEKGQKFEDIVGTYAYIKLANGFEKTAFMSREDLEHVKDISPSGASQYSPWNSNSIKMCKTKVTKELAKDMFTLFSGRVNSILARAIESDEISVKKIDEKGNIINDDAIYQESETIPIIDEPQKVNIEEL